MGKRLPLCSEVDLSKISLGSVNVTTEAPSTTTTIQDSKVGRLTVHGEDDEIGKYRRSKKIRYITLHYSCGPTASGTLSTFHRRYHEWKAKKGKCASTEYAVDDTTILQILDPDKWSSCGTCHCNDDAVQIEMSVQCDGCNGMPDPCDPRWRFTAATISNTRWLVQYLMKKYGIPKTNIRRHYDCLGCKQGQKRCPGVIGWIADTRCKHDNEYKNFIASL